MNRVALVTGSSRGIGRATVERLAQNYACVVHHRRSPETAEDVATGIRQRGGTAQVICADLESADGLSFLCGEMADRFGRLDALVANAASTTFRPVLELERHHIERTMAGVVMSFVHLVSDLKPLLRDGSRIVAIGGLDQRFAQSGHGLLGAAKAAVEVLVRSLAVELGPIGCTVNAVVPGVIETESLRTYLRDRPDLSAALAAAAPVARLGTPADVAAAVEFLCADDSAFITGQSIVVDGGISVEGGPWASFRELWGRHADTSS